MPALEPTSSPAAAPAPAPGAAPPATNDAAPTLTELMALDAAGWLAGADESAAAWRERAEKARADFRAAEARLDAGERLDFGEGLVVGKDDRIPPAELAAATRFTAERYAFAFADGLGFYLRHGVGPLWAGCAFYDPEKKCCFFLLREAFRAQEKYLWLYSRGEIVTHELCHVVRAPLLDDEFEEYFAYQCSPSRLRRYLGNCFLRPRDALLVLVPSLLLLAARLAQAVGGWGGPAWPAALALALGAGWLLLRNHRARVCLSRAAANLRRAGAARPEAVLFRCAAGEIHRLAALDDPGALRAAVGALAAGEARWQVIRARFFGGEAGGA